MFLECKYIIRPPPDSTLIFRMNISPLILRKEFFGFVECVLCTGKWKWTKLILYIIYTTYIHITF